MRIFIFICSIDFLLSIIGYFYWRYTLFGRSLGFALIYMLLTITAAVSVLLPPTTPLWLTKLFAWLEGLWIAFGYYTLLLIVLHAIFLIFAKLFFLKPSAAKFAAFGLIFISGFIAWGSWRAFHPTIRTETITTKKLPPQSSYKIVFLTDLHLGRILGNSYAADIAAKVNSLQPDFVLIAGDTIDERIFYVEEQDSLHALAQIQAPVYLSFGNHEYIDNPQRWQEMLQKEGFHVLRNADTIIDNRVKITGLEDFSRDKSTDNLCALAKNNTQYYNIIMDHQPRRFDAAALAGYDLYLAGHTHTGQLFPNRIITRRMYKLDYGRNRFGGMNAITSNGVGFWGPPVRTEVAPEIVVLNLKGK